MRCALTKRMVCAREKRQRTAALQDATATDRASWQKLTCQIMGAGHNKGVYANRKTAGSLWLGYARICSRILLERWRLEEEPEPTHLGCCEKKSMRRSAEAPLRGVARDCVGRGEHIGLKA